VGNYKTWLGCENAIDGVSKELALFSWFWYYSLHLIASLPLTLRLSYDVRSELFDCGLVYWIGIIWTSYCAGMYNLFLSIYTRSSSTFLSFSFFLSFFLFSFCFFLLLPCWLSVHLLAARYFAKSQTDCLWRWLAPSQMGHLQRSGSDSAVPGSLRRCHDSREAYRAVSVCVISTATTSKRKLECKRHLVRAIFEFIVTNWILAESNFSLGSFPEYHRVTMIR
jgi:hypothetical protein